MLYKSPAHVTLSRVSRSSEEPAAKGIIWQPEKIPNILHRPERAERNAQKLTAVNLQECSHGTQI